MQPVTSESYMKLLKYDIIKELSLPIQEEMIERHYYFKTIGQ